MRRASRVIERFETPFGTVCYEKRRRRWLSTVVPGVSGLSGHCRPDSACGAVLIGMIQRERRVAKKGKNNKALEKSGGVLM